MEWGQGRNQKRIEDLGRKKKKERKKSMIRDKGNGQDGDWGVTWNRERKGKEFGKREKLQN